MNIFAKLSGYFVLCAMLSLNLLPIAHAAGDVNRGQQLSTTCIACHNEDGNTTNPQWPKLAGQHASYLVTQMQLFKNGERPNPIMMPIMANFSEQHIEDLAAFYASQKTSIGTANPELVDRGKQLYRGGDIAKGIPACIACHGPDGRGNEQAGFPVLSGQNPDFTLEELEDYKASSRTSDLYGIMRTIAGRMDKEDMVAVASYIHGLH
jgi:cytochrome c553